MQTWMVVCVCLGTVTINTGGRAIRARFRANILAHCDEQNYLEERGHCMYLGDCIEPISRIFPKHIEKRKTDTSTFWSTYVKCSVLFFSLYVRSFVLMLICCPRVRALFPTSPVCVCVYTHILNDGCVCVFIFVCRVVHSLQAIGSLFCARFAAARVCLVLVCFYFSCSLLDFLLFAVLCHTWICMYTYAHVYVQACMCIHTLRLRMGIYLPFNINAPSWIDGLMISCI